MKIRIETVEDTLEVVSGKICVSADGKRSTRNVSWSGMALRNVYYFGRGM